MNQTEHSSKTIDEALTILENIYRKRAFSVFEMTLMESAASKLKLKLKQNTLTQPIKVDSINNNKPILKVYLAGPISADPKKLRHRFNVIAHYLKKMNIAVLNPASLPMGLDESEYMDICCAMIRSCEKVIMLKGWEESEGATAEYYLAKKLGKPILLEKNIKQKYK